MPDPAIYILNGDDEFAINEFIARLQGALGDATMAEMNTARLDGRATTLDQLVNAVSAMPFLAKRRLVVVTNPLSLAKARSESAKQKFLDVLTRVPETTQLVLIENNPLTDPRDRKRGKIHWLEAWANVAGERVSLKQTSLPRGPAMTQWILSRAKTLGGQFTPPAAARLADQIGDDPRLADQEIQKLLAYANYTRAVEPDDVEHLTPSNRQGDIFAMVDAVANRQGKRAQEMLHLLLAEQDAIQIFGMVVRQFRLLLLAREVMDGGGYEDEAAHVMGVHPYVAEKAFAQARMFSLPAIETIYHRLLELDEAIKTSQIDDALALDILIAGLAR
ncbi:MAG: DNA polymerase III subunit delta [Chloroflexota bacterium]